MPEMKSNKPIRSQETMDLLLGRQPKPKVQPRPKPKPDRGVLGVAEQRALTRWHKPLPAILGEALAVNRGLLERLALGVHGPDMKGLEQYRVIFNGLYQATQQQLEALDVFGEVDWSE